MARDTGSKVKAPALACRGSHHDGPTVVFAHGAKGSKDAPEVTNLCSGVSRHLPIVAFDSPGPLEKRILTYEAVLEHLEASDPNVDVVLGGRSLGARAAVTIANGHPGRYKRLLLVSYPLHRTVDGVEEVRDQILLDLAEDREVLLIIGGRDAMCDLARLRAFIARMKCLTWLIVVDGANHMMELSGQDGKVDEAATRAVGIKMGEVTAQWLKDSHVIESAISWHAETAEAVSH